jgi:hypothetical protein
MATLLIIFSFLVIFFIFFNQDSSIRDALLKSFLVLFLKFLIINEFLSLFEWINFQSLIVAWILTAGFELFIMVKYSQVNNIKSNLRTIGSKTQDWISDKVNFVILGSILFVLVVTLFISLVSPPNNFDSMTYHMPRVAHWIQNQSIDFYATSNSRQNLSMPLAEYAILHFQVLSRSDRFANFVQWMSFAIAIVTTSLIAREVKVGKRTQLITGLLAATIPMGILQSSTTQNDLVVAAFCLAFLYFMILSVNQLSPEKIGFAGISMGLALLSKGTAYLYCAAIGTVYGLYLMIKSGGKTKVRIFMRLVGVISIALILNSGHITRIISSSSNEFISDNQEIVVNKVSLVITGANLIRNSAIHLATPISDLNQFIERKVVGLLGPELSNPDSTFLDSSFSMDFFINENRSVNLIHFVLISFAVFISPWLMNKNRERRLLWLVLIGVLILFSMFLKWQLWTSRLQTTIFFVGVIVVAIILDKLLDKNWLTFVISLFLVVFSLPYLFLSTTRPVLPILSKKSAIKNTKPILYTKNRIDKYLIQHPELERIFAPIRLNFQTDQSLFLTERDQLYFFASKQRYDDYVGAVDVVMELDVDVVGLVLFSNHWEYPFWVLSNSHAGQSGLVFHHVIPEQLDDGSIPKIDQYPSVIISTKDQDLPFLKTEYDLIYNSPRVRVYSLE